jgi:hypothetical protein
MNYRMDKVTTAVDLSLVILLFGSETNRGEHQELLYVLFGELLVFNGKEQSDVGAKGVTDKGCIGWLIVTQN